MSLFVLRHLALLALLAIVADGFGWALTRRLAFASEAAARGMRGAAGVALLALLTGLAGLAGTLNGVTACALAALGLVLAVAGRRPLPRLKASRALPLAALVALLAAPVVLFALYPPTVFDETLYHLPTARAFATAHSLPFLTNLRFPVFTHAAEGLQAMLLLAGGDVATHLLALLSTMLTALLGFAWAEEKGGAPAGWLAAALLLSGAIVVKMATSSNVEAPLVLFVSAALYAFDRWATERRAGWLAAAAFLAGSSASVKYLGLFWVFAGAAGALIIAAKGQRARSLVLFAAVAAIAMAPWYGRILWYTHNPVFPYAHSIFGHSAWDASGDGAPGRVQVRALRLARLPWQALVKGRRGWQAPFPPLFPVMMLLVAAGALRERRTRVAAALVLAWLAVYAILPPDSRYLMATLPLVAAAAAVEAMRLAASAPRVRHAIAALCLLIVLPGPLDAAYRIRNRGWPPVTAQQRDALLTRAAPGYAGVAWLNRQPGAREKRAYVCGGEQLKFYYDGTMLGDYFGLGRYDSLAAARTPTELARQLDALGVSAVLVVPSRCPVPLLTRGELGPFYAEGYRDMVSVVWLRAGK